MIITMLVQEDTTYKWLDCLLQEKRSKLCLPLPSENGVRLLIILGKSAMCVHWMAVALLLTKAGDVGWTDPVGVITPAGHLDGLHGWPPIERGCRTPPP